MSDLGLLMADPMARACHDGRKTVTRRPMVVQPCAVEVMDLFDGRCSAKAWFPADGGALAAATTAPTRADALMDVLGPAIISGAGTATVGGRVWIRECWDLVAFGPPNRHERVAYRASTPDRKTRWRPSIHMPKWACRTWGIITSVRPERLQDITDDDDDAKREGFTKGLAACGMLPHVAAFRSTWNDCYAARGLGWDTNPWVWRIEWERIERPGDL